MDKILTTFITGVFSLLSALGSVWLQDRLERRRPAPPREPAAAPQPSREKAGPPPAAASGWSWRRPFLVFLGAFVFGVATRALRPVFGHGIHWESLIAILTLAAVSLWLAIDHRRGRSRFWPYQLEALALWLAWASGWSAVHGSAWSDLIVVGFLWWLGCAVVGGLVAAVGRGEAEA